jgi:hypothetical protein
VKLAIVRAGILLSCVALLQSCGGSGGGSLGSGRDARLNVSPRNVNLEASPGEATPVEPIVLNITNPVSNLYLSGRSSTFGIEHIDVVQSGSSTVRLEVHYKPPGSLPDGRYEDTIDISVCTNEHCGTHIRGSPVTINSAYTIESHGIPVATIDRTDVSVEADPIDTSPSGALINLTLNREPASGVFLRNTPTLNGLRTHEWRQRDLTWHELALVFATGQEIPPGTYHDTVLVEVCFDPSCVRQAQGSPFMIRTTLTLGATAEPGYVPLEVASRTALTHDVIDADFSKPLNQIVTVSGAPTPALYVYDVATGAEARQPLSLAPTSVSVSPDGMSAAVGHDAHVTVVALPTVGHAAAPAPTLLDVDAAVTDLMLDGAGFVHVLSQYVDSAPTRSVHIATNTQRVGLSEVDHYVHGKVAPGGFIYTANGLAVSPSNVAKWDISSGVMSHISDSEYFTEHQAGNDLWLSDDGTRIYSGVGDTYSAHVDPVQDLQFIGNLALTNPGYLRSQIASLSVMDAKDEIVLIEFDYRNCLRVPAFGPCYTHFATYEASTLVRTALYGIGPADVNGGNYAERGLFVFHDQASGRKLMISRLENVADPAAAYYLSVIE